MIKREKYLRRIRPYIGKPVIKVITGIRRCGKSTFLRMLIEELKSGGASSANIIYINKDSLRFDFIKNYSDLHDYVTKQISVPEEDNYLLIDEVQEIDQWEKAVAGFFADEIADIYITGSNAGMFSTDLATLLTGRYIEMRLNTLVFSEHLMFRNKTPEEAEEEFGRFLKYGGFPGIHKMQYEEEVLVQYINAIYSTILLKDVVTRHKVRDVALLEKIARYLAGNCGNITTAKSISDYIKSQRLTSSSDTVQNYLYWLADAFMVHKVSRYDIKGKRQLEVYDKYFMGDTGFIFGVLGDKMQDISGKLENIVYLELISRGYKVSIGKLYNSEIDFIATKGGEKLYIQVAYLLAGQKVIDREFSPLEAVRDNYPKLVLSADKYSGAERNGVRWANIVDFLLGEGYGTPATGPSSG